MIVLRSIGVANIFTSVLEKFMGPTPSEPRDANTSAASEENEARAPPKLKFHVVHGRAVKVSKYGSIARRNPMFFEHSVVFSNRPVAINEIVAVEIKEVTNYFNGPLRVGFISIDPASFQHNVPTGRDLKDRGGVWLKSIHMHPMEVGTVVYYQLKRDGTVLYGINGVQEGALVTGANTNVLPWAVVEIYGSVQSVGFVDKTMLFLPNLPVANEIGNMEVHLSPNLEQSTRMLTRSLRRQLENQTLDDSGDHGLPLRIRRNVRLSPLQNFNRVRIPPAISSSPRTPSSTDFFSPNFSPGLCIICAEREKNTAFTKCGHLCMCYECAQAFQTRQGSSRSRQRQICPICRAPISSILRIYH